MPKFKINTNNVPITGMAYYGVEVECDSIEKLKELLSNAQDGDGQAFLSQFGVDSLETLYEAHGTMDVNWQSQSENVTGWDEISEVDEENDFPGLALLALIEAKRTRDEVTPKPPAI